MNEAVDEKPMMQNLEDFLTGAVVAEKDGDFGEAERLFGMALFCEAQLRPEVIDAGQYVIQAGPVYAVAQPKS